MNSYTAIPCDEDIQAQAIYILKTMLNMACPQRSSLWNMLT